MQQLSLLPLVKCYCYLTMLDTIVSLPFGFAKPKQRGKLIGTSNFSVLFFHVVKLKKMVSSSVVHRKDISISWRCNDMYVGQEDPSQVFALASVWFLILAFGGLVCLVPVLYTINLAYQDTIISETAHSSQPAAIEFIGMLNSILLMLLGSVIGCPIASASGNVAFSSFHLIILPFMLNLFRLVY